MDIDCLESSLQMINFYFSHCSFDRQATLKDEKLTIDLQRGITQLEEHHYSVELVVTANGENLKLKVVANAEFLYQSDTYEHEEALIKKNTVAIMFPFIRSQFTLMTSQPGMSPIVLPIINTEKMDL